MRVNFKTKSIVMNPKLMKNYFKENGCHCVDEFGKKCPVQLGATFLSMYYHLAHIERSTQSYIVFEGSFFSIPLS